MECTDCTEGEVSFDNECRDSCLDGYIEDSSGKCILCQLPDIYYYKNVCYKSCPKKTKLKKSTYICEDICDGGYYDKTAGCVICSTLSKHLSEGNCVVECPEGTIPSGGVCQSSLSKGNIISLSTRQCNL
jgi:hypothetical protein